MSNKKTGGPAFPTEVWDSEGAPQHTEGMTLRDYFAAKAMQSIRETAPATTYENIARYAYELADAMIAAREDE